MRASSQQSAASSQQPAVSGQRNGREAALRQAQEEPQDVVSCEFELAYVFVCEVGRC